MCPYLTYLTCKPYKIDEKRVEDAMEANKNMN